MERRAGLIAAAISVVAGSPALAQDALVGEVVVTAAPYAISLDSATTSVDVLTRDELDLRPSGGLGEALSGLAGVRSSFFGPGASRPVIRGLSGPRVLVLSNGLGQVDASALSPDHAVATDPQEAERIEVLRGPAALAYGGSAIGGVVNIIDGRIATTPATGMHGRILVNRSSVDHGSTVGGSLKAGSGPLVLTIDGLRRQSEDYKTPTFPESRRLLESEGEPWPGDLASVVDNTFARLKAYGAGVSYAVTRGFVGLSAKRTETAYGVPGHEHSDEQGAEVDEAGVSIDLEQTRYDLRGERRGLDGPFETIRLAVGYADYTHAELEGGAVGTRFISQGLEGRLELIQPSRRGWQGAVGFQWLARDFEAIGDEAFVPPNKTSEWGVFTLQRLDRGHWGLEGGLRLERHAIDSAQLDRSFAGVSASLGGFARPAAGWFVGLSGSRTERAPAREELLADGPHPATRVFETGDPDLGPEVSYSLDLTTHYKAGLVAIDAHAFAARYEGFIDLRPTGVEDADSGLPVHAFVQTDATFHGVEVEGGAQIWENRGRTVRLEAAADYVRGSTDAGPPARIPPWSVTGRGVFESSRLTGMVELRRVGGQDRVSAYEMPTEGHTLMNASLVLRPTPDERFRIHVDVRNLTNREAREHASFLKDVAPLPGRNIRIGAGYSF